VDFAVSWMEHAFSQPNATGTVEVRQATASDVESIRALQERWRDEQITFGYEPSSRERIEQAIGPLAFVAALGDRVVGFGYGERRVSPGLAVMGADEHYLEVVDLYVAPEFRNLNLGARLLESLVATCKTQCLTLAHVFSATKDHDAVLRFYRRRGFVPWGVQLYRRIGP
jgi:ribosomal protein S18 acetylase RimI-like enzyme